MKKRRKRKNRWLRWKESELFSDWTRVMIVTIHREKIRTQMLIGSLARLKGS